MKTVFADAFYWVAITNPHDQWHARAREVCSTLGSVRLLTTDEVLVEFMSALGRYGQPLRHAAAKMVRAIIDNPNVTVVPQSRNSFLQGVALYQQRPDKKYSLTDCISMNTMQTYGVCEVLTGDHHFEQEGFVILIKPDA